MIALLSDQQKAGKAKVKKAFTSFDHTINIDALPTPVRDYIRLQHEITGRDVGQKPFFFPKESVNNFAQNGTEKVEKERKKRRQWWYEFLLMQIKLYSQIFAQTWLKIELAEKQIEMMEEQLDQMDDLPFSDASSGIRQKINTVKEDLQGFKEQLLNKPEPTEADMIEIQENIDARMEKLERYFENFNSIRKKAQNLIVKSSAYSYFSVKNFIESKIENFSKKKIPITEDYTPTEYTEAAEIHVETVSENNNSPAN